jgi:hypothetical protein
VVAEKGIMMTFVIGEFMIPLIPFSYLCFVLFQCWLRILAGTFIQTEAEQKVLFVIRITWEKKGLLWETVISSALIVFKQLGWTIVHKGYCQGTLCIDFRTEVGLD